MLIRRVVSHRVVAVLILFAAFAVFAQEQVERVFVVKGVVGDVKVRRNPSADRVRRERAVDTKAAAERQEAREARGAQWAPARLNMTIRERDEVMTGPKSEVRVETPEGTIIKLGENTAVEVAVMQFGAEGRRRANTAADRKSGVTDTKVKVNEGSVVANVNKMLNSQSSFRFETPTATAAIRGTVLEIEVQKRAEAPAAVQETPPPARGSSAADRRAPSAQRRKAPPPPAVNTVIRAFEGTVLVTTPSNPEPVELTDNKMVEVAPRQRAVVVKEVPKDHVRMTTRLSNEPEPEPKPESKLEPKPEPEPVRVTLDLKDLADTLSLYARDSVSITGVVRPVTARVVVNGVEARPDADGTFKVTFSAPSDSGVYSIKIEAAEGEVSETVIRTMKVAHVYTASRVLTPRDGLVVDKPVVTVSGTAMPGSVVTAQGVRLTLKRDGTFTGDVSLPDKEGEYTIQVEIVDKDDNAIWIERNITYKKRN